MRIFFTDERIKYFHVIGKRKDGCFIGGASGGWEILAQEFCKIQKKQFLLVHAMTVMSNHFHALVSVESISCMDSLGAQLLKLDLDTSYFQIEHVKYYRIVYRYIYRNPIEAGIVICAEQYPHGTLPGLLGKKRIQFRCVDNMNLIYDPARILKWINEPAVFTVGSGHTFDPKRP